MHLCLQADVSASGYRPAYLAFPGVPCILLAGFMALAFVFLAGICSQCLGLLPGPAGALAWSVTIASFAGSWVVCSGAAPLPTSPLTPPPGFAALVLGLSNSCWMGSTPRPTRAALLRRWSSYDGKDLCNNSFYETIVVLHCQGHFL